VSAELEEAGWEEVSLDDRDHAGPWPAFMDLFVATSLILLVLFIVIAFRYVKQTGDIVRVRELYAELKKVEQGNRFLVREQKPDVLIILEEAVTFPVNEWRLSTLQQPAKQTLRRVDSLLRAPQFAGLVREVEVLGHADRRGDSFENWRLSAHRAVTVAEFMVDTLKRSPCEVVPSGRGAFFPRDTTVNPERLPTAARRAAYARDRRIEVLLHPVVAGEDSASRQGCRAP
jgi:outer membrane protein OmpA-like peptidoglycan-associated protein